MLFCAPGGAQSPPGGAQSNNKTVLFIHSEAADAPVFVAEEQRIRRELQSSLAGKVQFFVEYMDHSRVEHPGSADSLAAYLHEKYASKQVDLIVSIGPEALPFAVAHRKEFAPHAPVVFSYPDEGFLKRTSLPSDVTGLVPQLEVTPTINLILMLHPETKQIAIILGPTSTRPNLASNLQSVKNQLKPFENRLAFLLIGEGRISDIASQVAALPSGTPILYLFYVGDEGKDFISAVNAADVVTRVAKGPVYDVSDAHLGHGIVGGWLNSDADYQSSIAQLALHVLQGATLSPAGKSPGGRYIFDERQLEKWKIDPEKLPLGSEIRFHQPTLWEQYKWWMIAGAGVMIFQALLILGLLVQHRKRLLAEKGLLEQSDALHEAQRLAGVGSWQWDARTDTVTWSKELYRIVGRDPRLPAPSYKEHPGVYAAESWERLQLAVTEALQTGSAYELDLNINHPDSNTRWATARGEPVRDTHGQIIGLHGTVQDITERKHAEETLRESEKRASSKAKELETLLNTAPIALYIATDTKCSQITANRIGYELLNLQIGDNASKSAPEHQMPSYRIMADGVELPSEELPMQVAASTGVYVPATSLSVVLADGTVRHLLANAAPLFDTDGKPCGAVGSTLDVTDRKLAEEALASLSHKLIEAQEVERTRIARELHDDFSQRLAILAINLAQLNRDYSGMPVDLGHRLSELGKMTSELTGDIQTLSHELHSSKLEYLGLARALKGFCKEFAEHQKVEIDFESHDLPNPLESQTALCLYRVAQEALHNSAKHSGARHFEVRLWGSDDGIHLTVKDAGAGFQTKTTDEGQGIGIASMKERLRLLNGTFSIESRASRGTTIHACLPLNEPSYPDQQSAGNGGPRNELTHSPLAMFRNDKN
jgi:signal transduction histidine kinase